MNSNQQQHQQQHENDESESVYVNELVAAQSNTNVVYAQIVATNQGHDKVISSNKKNDDHSVIYSELEGVGSGTRTVAPSDDLYANISWFMIM